MEWDLATYDRVLLRQMYIDPESTPVQDMIDVICAPAQYKPNAVIIPASIARQIIAEYGELNIDTYLAFRSGRNNGEKKNRK